MDDVELKDWLASLDYVLNSGTSDRVQYLLQQLQIRAQESGVTLPFTYNTPYINTIPKNKQPAFPGNREMNGVSNPLSAGTPWPWWSGPINLPTVSVGIFPPMPHPPRFMKSVLTTFSADARTLITGIGLFSGPCLPWYLCPRLSGRPLV